MFQDFERSPDLADYFLALDKLSDYFVKSFEDPENAQVILFWKSMCPAYGIKGWLAVFNAWDTTDAELGLSYPLVVGPGAGLTLNTYAGPIKEPCVSLGYRKLNFWLDYLKGPRSKECVTFAARKIGTYFCSGPDGLTVQTLSAWVNFLWHEGQP